MAILGAQLFTVFDGATAASQFMQVREWFSLPGATATPIDVHFSMGVDGISILMVALTALLMPLVALSTVGHIKTRVKEFLIWLLVMETGMLGVFLAQDLVLFYFFWEISLVPLYFMVGIWGGERRLYATLKFFLYTMAGSLLMLIAVIALVYTTGTTDIATLTARAGDLPLSTQGWLFAGLRRGLRHQGAVGALPHLAGRRPHGGAHVRFGDPGRRVAEDGDLRPPALRHRHVPRRRGGGGAALHGAGHRGHRVRRVLGHGADRHQSA